MFGLVSSILSLMLKSTVASMADLISMYFGGMMGGCFQNFLLNQMQDAWRELVCEIEVLHWKFLKNRKLCCSDHVTFLIVLKNGNEGYGLGADP